MKYIMDSAQMKKIDEFSIKEAGIPSMVLMERAALTVTEAVMDELKGRGISFSEAKVLCVCGSGNNGADGMAAARQLSENGISAEVYPVFEEGKGTEELKSQLAVIKKLEIPIINKPDFFEYNCIVDSLFGIGLSRDVESVYKDTIRMINDKKAQNAFVVAVDIPSGINASDGRVMGIAVEADITVTFGYTKKGLCLYPGKNYAGEVKVRNAGFADLRFISEVKSGAAFTFEEDDIKKYFYRPKDANKGTFGKLLIAAGSENMAGAAVLSAMAAYRTGSGLVKIFTHEKNREIILSHVPEAVLVTYKEGSDAAAKLALELDWADCVVAGPGISKSETARVIVSTITGYKVPHGKKLPVVFDADALNIISEDKEKYLKNKDDNICCVYTPHMGEMSRLMKMEIPEIKNNICKTASEAGRKLHGICVLKDAATVVSDGEKIYINSSGNQGMATAGSGDVLTGIIAGVILQQIPPQKNSDDENGISLYKKVCMGVYLHGKAGDLAAKQQGIVGMKALDIAENAGRVVMALDISKSCGIMGRIK